MANPRLDAAKKRKDDEFYTAYSDVEAEASNYDWSGKRVYCNCDTRDSAFWRYFDDNFEKFGLKTLTCSAINGEAWRRDKSGTYPLSIESGDFRANKKLLDECDVVVTNPPFSLFREYAALLVEHEKKFLIIGSQNAITYKEFFPLLKDNKAWLGYNAVKEFSQPDGSIKKFGNICWYTNLDTTKRHEKLPLWETYSTEKFPHYDNYDAIEVSRTALIPADYDGVMGVPISFLDKWNPDQFEIIKFRKGDDDKDLSVNGKCPYFRILIQRKASKTPPTARRTPPIFALRPLSQYTHTRAVIFGA